MSRHARSRTIGPNIRVAQSAFARVLFKRSASHGETLMPPENLRFGGGASETVLHPIVLAAMLIAIALIFLLPRKYVLWSVLSATFLIPLGQEILIGGLHFFVFRIIVLTVAVRMLGSMFASPEGIFGDRLDTFDVVFLLWAVFRALAGVLVFSFHPGAMVYHAG